MSASLIKELDTLIVRATDQSRPLEERSRDALEVVAKISKHSIKLISIYDWTEVTRWWKLRQQERFDRQRQGRPR